MSGISPVTANAFIRQPAQAAPAQAAQANAASSGSQTAGASQSAQPAAAQATQARASKVVDPRDVDGDGGAVTTHEIALYNEKHPNAAAATQTAQANAATSGPASGKSIDIRA